jgi:hypothetical protein
MRRVSTSDRERVGRGRARGTASQPGDGPAARGVRVRFRAVSRGARGDRGAGARKRCGSPLVSGSMCDGRWQRLRSAGAGRNVDRRRCRLAGMGMVVGTGDSVRGREGDGRGRGCGSVWAVATGERRARCTLRSEDNGGECKRRERLQECRDAVGAADRLGVAGLGAERQTGRSRPGPYGDGGQAEHRGGQTWSPRTGKQKCGAEGALEQAQGEEERALGPPLAEVRGMTAVWIASAPSRQARRCARSHGSRGRGTTDSPRCCHPDRCA